MLERILNVLEIACCRGAAEILAVRNAGDVGAGYKDARELVTVADRRSDAAILATFQTMLPAIDPDIAFHLEESGITGDAKGKIAGADPLDGTNHFACGGAWYSVQAHYVEDGVPLAGVVLQPEVYLPLAETDRPLGRIVKAAKGSGAWTARTEFVDGAIRLGDYRRVTKRENPPTRTYAAAIPISTKMNDEERARALRVYNSGLLSVTTGTGGAGANAMMVLFGGHHIYANFGAGEDLDLIPPQIIAEEAGLTVWDWNAQPPRWRNITKQPFLLASEPAIARLFLTAAGLGQ
jgi:3'-phosphoadenosine 5'-phosphosulfate (PAPS) 3'-phosphatase